MTLNFVYRIIKPRGLPLLSTEAEGWVWYRKLSWVTKSCDCFFKYLRYWKDFNIFLPVSKFFKMLPIACSLFKVFPRHVKTIGCCFYFFLYFSLHSLSKKCANSLCHFAYVCVVLSLCNFFPGAVKKFSKSHPWREAKRYVSLIFKCKIAITP